MGGGGSTGAAVMGRWGWTGGVLRGGGGGEGGGRLVPRGNVFCLSFCRILVVFCVRGVGAKSGVSVAAACLKKVVSVVNFTFCFGNGTEDGSLSPFVKHV